MRLFERYIFRQVFSAFFITASLLTAIFWLTQAMRLFDLLTAKGQSIGTYFLISSLVVPFILLVVIPLSVLIACLFVLARLNSDSEYVTFAAAGISRWVTLRPFLYVAACAAFLSWVLALYLAPQSLRAMRHYKTQVVADVLARGLRPGQFRRLEHDLVLRIKERSSDGAFSQIFLSDNRDTDVSSTYLAQRGMLVRQESGAFLVMQNGHIIQRRNAAPAPGPSAPETGDNARQGQTIVSFQTYAFDLSELTGGITAPHYRPREFSTRDLARGAYDQQAQQSATNVYRAELHDRLSQPLYAFAFALIAFAALGRAQPARQGRGFIILNAVVCALAIRLAGYTVTGAAAQWYGAIMFLYAIPATASIIALLIIAQVLRPRVPQALLRLLAPVKRRLSRYLRTYFPAPAPDPGAQV